MFFEEFRDLGDSFLACRLRCIDYPAIQALPPKKKRERLSPPSLGFSVTTRLLLVAAAVVAGLRGEGLPFLFGQFFLYDRGTLEFVGKNRLHQIAAIHCLRCQKH